MSLSCFFKLHFLLNVVGPVLKKNVVGPVLNRYNILNINQLNKQIQKLCKVNKITIWILEMKKHAQRVYVNFSLLHSYGRSHHLNTANLVSDFTLLTPVPYTLS